MAEQTEAKQTLNLMNADQLTAAVKKATESTTTAQQTMPESVIAAPEKKQDSVKAIPLLCVVNTAAQTVGSSTSNSGSSTQHYQSILPKLPNSQPQLLKYDTNPSVQTITLVPSNGPSNSEITNQNTAANLISELAKQLQSGPVIDHPGQLERIEQVQIAGYFCNTCSCFYQSSAHCPAHTEPNLIVMDRPIPSHARLTLPQQLVLHPSNINSGSLGIRTKIALDKKTQFGPLIGKTLTKEEVEDVDITEKYQIWKVSQPIYRKEKRWCVNLQCEHYVFICRLLLYIIQKIFALFDVLDSLSSQVFQDGSSLSHGLSLSDESDCNWMMFVQRARSSTEQNLVAYLSNAQIFFMSTSFIPANTELLYWFSIDYCRLLGLPLKPQDGFSCPQCEKQFITVHALERHKRYLHPDTAGRKWQCPTCQKFFSSAAKLSVHTYGHMGIKPYKCQHCNKQFTDASNLRGHLSIHTGERRFTCDTCGKAFRQKAHLTSHYLTHSGEKRLKCHYCERWFARASDLRQHEYSHTHERQFPCPVCKKVFYRLQTQKKHMKMHDGQKDFECSGCKKRFITKYHMERHHKGCSEKQSEKRNIQQNNFSVCQPETVQQLNLLSESNS